MENVKGEFVRVYKPFKCDENKCGLRFLTSSELKIHYEDFH